MTKPSAPRAVIAAALLTIAAILHSFVCEWFVFAELEIGDSERDIADLELWELTSDVESANAKEWDAVAAVYDGYFKADEECSAEHEPPLPESGATKGENRAWLEGLKRARECIRMRGYPEMPLGPFVQFPRGRLSERTHFVRGLFRSRVLPDGPWAEIASLGLGVVVPVALFFGAVFALAGSPRGLPAP